MEYILKRSKRKSLCVTITEEGDILVKAPLRMPLRHIETFLSEKEDWIVTHQNRMKQRCIQLEKQENKITIEEARQMAKEVVPPRLHYYEEILGVKATKLSYRNAKTRWGSCNEGGNIMINLRLMMAPLELLDYVIVHELCHRKQMNHSRLFWQEVESVLPDYKSRRASLKEEGWKWVL